MNLTPEQAAVIYDQVPPNAVLTGFVSVITWIDADSGEERWDYWHDCDAKTSTMVGLLEMTKHVMIHAEEANCPEVER